MLQLKTLFPIGKEFTFPLILVLSFLTLPLFLMTRTMVSCWEQGRQSWKLKMVEILGSSGQYPRQKMRILTTGLIRLVLRGRKDGLLESLQFCCTLQMPENTWERIPLSAQLPGDMVYIKATGEKSAEMVTDEGAIYITSNRGYNWRAAVQESVSATLNRTVSSGISGASYYTGTFNTVNRSPNGNYVAVSSRGNFYLTWEPGQAFWQPHNRAIARRIQNMGWRADGGLWLLVRGGGLYLSKGTGISEEFEEIPVQSRGFGILDVGYRSKEEAWAAGGSGVLLRTTNGGKTWTRDKAADNIAANLYSVYR
uniref:Photosynthesis system II assembly factor Ycf48/Hcf136-like domain-containing protein n=1 Tax=Salix viminalis TaxID=40686 RepID=A0A6N2LJR5_SALVM